LRMMVSWSSLGYVISSNSDVFFSPHPLGHGL
jgi:hypothetical protein